MGEPVPVSRACGLCGDQITLFVETKWSEYTDDLAALLNTQAGDQIVVKATCSCPTPHRVELEGTTFS